MLLKKLFFAIILMINRKTWVIWVTNYKFHCVQLMIHNFILTQFHVKCAILENHKKCLFCSQKLILRRPLKMPCSKMNKQNNSPFCNCVQVWMIIKAFDQFITRSLIVIMMAKAKKFKLWLRCGFSKKHFCYTKYTRNN